MFAWFSRGTRLGTAVSHRVLKSPVPFKVRLKCQFLHSLSSERPTIILGFPATGMPCFVLVLLPLLDSKGQDQVSL